MKNCIVLIVLLALVGCQNTRVKEQGSHDEFDMRAVMISLGANPKYPDRSELNKHPLGSAENPITVVGARGENEYIAGLVCLNGEPVSSWDRLGSSGESPYGFVMDIYNVICDTNNGVVETILYMDMYHQGNEPRAANGFLAKKQNL